MPSMRTRGAPNSPRRGRSPSASGRSPPSSVRPAAARRVSSSGSCASSCAGTSSRSPPTSGSSTTPSLKLVDALVGAGRRARGGSREQAGGSLRELEERLARLERRGSPPAGGSRACDRCGAAGRGCGSGLLRASRAGCAAASTRSASASVATSTTCGDAAPVLDVGCGRGELARSAARSRASRRAASTPTPTWSPTRAATGLDVEQADLVEYLEAAADGSLGGDLHGPGRRAPPAADARAGVSSSPPRSCARAACSSPRRSIRCRRSRCATTSPT